MFLSFRQGIVQHEQPGFLTINPTTVSLVVVDTPIIITISSGTKNYLHIERESITNAWTSITPGIDQWLYWDIHTATGVRTFGVTLLNPISQPFPPTPITDQHWFDTTTKTTKVWNGVRWVEKLRVFACKLSNGSVPISMSLLVPIFTGTQANLNESGYAGQIMFDSITGNVLKAGNKFVTTEDVLTLQSLTKSDVKFASMVVRAEAQQPMDAYTIVKFIDFGRISYADAFVANRDFVYGMIQQSCLPGDVTNVVITGVVTNPDWDWSPIGVNAPLYCSPGGTLVSTPSIPRQIPVATVLDTKTIILSTPRSGSSEPTTVVAALDDLTDVTITTPNTGQVLTFNGVEWVNGQDYAGYRQLFTAITGQTSFTLINPYIPNTNAISVYINGVRMNPGTFTEPDSTHVLMNDPTDAGDEVLIEQVTSYPTTAPIYSNLNDLTDVTITTPANNQFLKYNGTAWVNDVIPSSSPITWNATDNILYGPTLVAGSWNTAYGKDALAANTGGQNVAVGIEALNANITGTNNTAVGPYAGKYATGFYNVVLGYDAGNHVSSNSNVAIGTGAGYNLGNNDNVAIGTNALYGNTTNGCYENVAIGRDAMTATTLGMRNIALGSSSQFGITTGQYNVGIGYETLYNNTTGSSNIAIGYDSLFNTSGNENIAIGFYAGKDASGSNMVSIGSNAQQSFGSIDVLAEEWVVQGYEYIIRSPGDTDFTLSGAINNDPGTIFTATSFLPTGTGTVVMANCSNTAIGYQSLYGNNMGIQNTAIGYQSMWYAVGNPSNNTAVGYQALYNINSGTGNVGIGCNSLYSTIAGWGNVGIGELALHDNIDGNGNVGIGTQSLQSNNLGSLNIGVGFSSLLSNTTGWDNIGIGVGAMNNNTTGSSNVAIGNGALHSNTTGSYNTTIGYTAGENLTTGSNNTLIGGYKGTTGMTNNVILSTGDGIVRFQHDGTNWASATPISMAGLILSSTTSPITLNSSTGTAGQVLTSAGPGATPTWADNTASMVPYDVVSSFAGTLQNADILLKMVVPRNIVIESSGHVGYTITPPSGTNAVFTVYKSLAASIGSLVSIGTITFNASSAVVSSSSITQTNFAAGDMITITCTTASNIADVFLTVKGHT